MNLYESIKNNLKESTNKKITIIDGDKKAESTIKAFEKEYTEKLDSLGSFYIAIDAEGDVRQFDSLSEITEDTESIDVTDVVTLIKAKESLKIYVVDTLGMGRDILYVYDSISPLEGLVNPDTDELDVESISSSEYTDYLNDIVVDCSSNNELLEAMLKNECFIPLKK